MTTDLGFRCTVPCLCVSCVESIQRAAAAAGAPTLFFIPTLLRRATSSKMVSREETRERRSGLGPAMRFVYRYVI